MSRYQAWWRRMKRRKNPESDLQRIRNTLVKEATYSAALAGFLSHAYNHGHGVRITIQVDGEQCGVAILAHPKEPIVEYLANWSCAQQLVKQERLDEWDKDLMRGGIPPVSGSVDSAKGLNWDDARDREGFSV
jgi:hypothetical protein